MQQANEAQPAATQLHSQKHYDAEITLPLEFYPLESVCLAAYDFLDKLFFYIYRENAGSREVKVAVKARSGNAMDTELYLEMFENELIRQALRSASAKMNREIRTHIIGRALASALPDKSRAGA